MDANVLIRGKGKERWVKAPDLIIGPFMTIIEPDEMLAEVVLSANPRAYRKQLHAGFTTKRRICPGSCCQRSHP